MYTVYLVPEAWDELKSLPGHVRQQARRTIDSLTVNPRPPESKHLRSEEADYELRRIRLDRWRILYIVTDVDEAIDVTAIKKRPPYDYGDLSQLLARVK